MKRLALLVGCVVTGLLLSGCFGGDSKSSETDAVSDDPTSVLDVPGAQVLKSWYSGGEVTTTVHPVELVDGHAVVTLDFALDPGGKQFTLGISLEADPSRKGAGGVRLVDLERDKVWTAGYDTEGVPAASKGSWYLKPGESKTTVTMFSAPQAENVDVFVPGVGLVRDVPVVEGGPGTPSIASLDLSGEVTFPDAAQLGTYTQSYLDGVSVAGQGEDQTVTLASDVLFDTDESDLTASAAQVVDEAVVAIKAASSGGEVQVVGHTDDVLSEDYNLELSIRRAQTVADRLAEGLGLSYTIVSEGKGESQPAVAGTSTEARAANRRVEITFSATQPVGFAGSVIPEADVPVSSGSGASVEYQRDESDQTVRISLTSMVRRDGYLVGTFDVSLVKDNDKNSGLNHGVRRWFGDGRYTGNLNDQDRSTGAWPVYLLTGEGKVFAAQYSSTWGKGDTVSFLADWHTVNSAPVGLVFRYDVVWPDPGTDTVSVEAADCFRIVDVPVKDE